MPLLASGTPTEAPRSLADVCSVSFQGAGVTAEELEPVPGPHPGPQRTSNQGQTVLWSSPRCRAVSRPKTAVIESTAWL
ncbi:unnamed protein product [Rangifer tarandus platyrhynchus]|uniref:Uncharacterized protein n=1 Tax=Rangifer tarandus platyrhynchus TaxID=3082113 RepID=A0AC59ZMW7_RANTA